MRSIIIFSLLAILSPIQGRMLSEKVEPLLYEGTFSTENAILYQHVRADFPDFGDKCSAYINTGGAHFASPYMQGKARLRIVGYDTLEDRDRMKSQLCDLMRSGDHILAHYKTLGEWGEVDTLAEEYGEVLIDIPAASLIGFGGGKVHFKRCSC